MHKFCLLLVLSVLAASCVASSGEVNTMSARVWEQGEQQRRMQGQLTALDQELTRIRTELEGVSTPMRATQANLWSEVEGLRTQTATIQGQMEELQRVLQGGGGEGARADLARQVAYLDRSVAMIASQLALDLGPRPGPDEFGPTMRPGQQGQEPATAQPPMQSSMQPPAQPPVQPTDAPRRQDSDDPAKALYERALEAFQSRNYAQARTMWDEFARTFPQHELVSNALFWQGESFFQMGDYSQAVLAYQDVISKHPQSNKYAAAMLKQGVCFFRLGKDRAGVLVLEDLIKRFPSLPEATRAKTILDERKKQ